MTYLNYIAPPLPHLLLVAEDTYQPGESHPRRTAIGVFDLLIVTKGCLPLGEGDVSWEVSAGEGVILRPDMTHYQTRPCSEETHFYIIHFHSLGVWDVRSNDDMYNDSSRPDSLREEIAKNPYLKPFGRVLSTKTGAVGKTVDVPVFLIAPFCIRISQYFSLSKPSQCYEKLRLLLFLESRPQQNVMWEQQSLFQELLREIASIRHTPQKEFEQVAEKAAEFVRANYKQTITNQIIRENLHYHPNYVSKCMKKVYGCTTLEYMLDYRIEQAKRMLVTTNWPITRISDELGFSYCSHFSKLFTSLAGTSPSKFRNHYNSNVT